MTSRNLGVKESEDRGRAKSAKLEHLSKGSMSKIAGHG